MECTSGRNGLHLAKIGGSKSWFDFVLTCTPSPWKVCEAWKLRSSALSDGFANAR